MNACLLDTHAIIWLLAEPGRVSERARAAIEAAAIVYVSAASLYEIEAKREQKRRRGLADELQALPADLAGHLIDLDFALVSIEPQQAVAAGLLDISHGDPWDRILLAQARDLRVPLISADARLREQAPDIVVW